MAKRAGYAPSRRGFMGGAALAVAGTAAALSPVTRSEASGDASTLPLEPSAGSTYAGFVPVAESAFFSTAHVEEYSTYNAPGKGDLWPSCWADDGNVYAANGDGSGLSDGPYWDTAVSVIQGTPPNLSGQTLAYSDAVGSVWSTDTQANGQPLYNRKPTGMACVDGALYLAIQDLNRSDFSDAPSASISKSSDHGRTWTWGTNAPTFDDRKGPMFGDHRFTTIMFLDFGKNYGLAIDGYVYAYGLDYNWRQSFSHRFPDPQDLFLGRVPKASIQDRGQWRFFAGMTRAGKPAWVQDIDQRAPVLEDFRRIYQSSSDGGQRPLSVVSQGSVVYVKALNRYLYTSWSEYTFEFYEAPAPWGPWSRFFTKDFGKYPWTAVRNGGYATTLFSKWISDDGRSLWLNANNFGHAVDNYHLSLRRVSLQPFASSTATNSRDGGANLATAPGAVVVCKCASSGNSAALNDGRTDVFETSADQELKTIDWWGYTWPRAYTLNTVVYTSGGVTAGAGWFANRLRVQVRQRREDGYWWVDVSGLRVDPPYPYDGSAGPGKAYTFTFDPIVGDGVRIIGTPVLATSSALLQWTTLLQETRQIRDSSNQGTYTADLSALLGGSAVYVRFRDAFPSDGWGPSVSHVTVVADGVTIADFQPTTAAELPFAFDLDGSSVAAGGWRFADGGSSFTYRVSPPAGTSRLELQVLMWNEFLVDATNSRPVAATYTSIAELAVHFR